MQRQSVLPTFPIYEHNGRDKVRANDGLTLGDFAWEPDPVDDGKLPISVFRKTTYLHVIRRNLFQHLAGFPESCAIYALRQYFGNGKRNFRIYGKILDKIKKFICDTVIASLKQDFNDSILADIVEGISKTDTAKIQCLGCGPGQMHSCCKATCLGGMQVSKRVMKT